MSLKVGDEFYEAWVDRDEGGIGIDLWVITTIRSGGATAIRKTPFTWVKVSTTTGDYGWARVIGGYDRRAFSLTAGVPAEWAQTKAAAYTKALPSVEASIKRLSKIRAQLLGQRTKARKPKHRASSAKRTVDAVPGGRSPTEGIDQDTAETHRSPREGRE